MSKQKAMRLVFGEALCAAAADRRLVVLDADVSSSTQTWLFGQANPDRFYNFGIAEANMVSAAAGMATCGLIPVVSTFAFLLALRAADPVRSLIAYNNLNVKLAGGYAGLSDYADGASHQSIMDLAIMRAMPNMTVLVPSDIETTQGAVAAMLQHNGPVYLRLSRDDVTSCHDGDTRFEIGRARVIRHGSDVTVAVCGTVLPAVIEAADRLRGAGIEAGIIEFATVKPFDTETLLSAAGRTGAVVSVEEHSVIGGLGSAIAEVLAERGSARLKRIGIQDTFGESGTYPALLQRHGLSAGLIAQNVRQWLQKGSR